MKTPEQERRAVAERQANADASSRDEPLPHPNPWDAYIDKPDASASREERLEWHRHFAATHEPKDYAMNAENTRILREKYPQLYPAGFEFRCGDGWFNLVDTMSAEIQQDLLEGGIVNQTFQIEELKEKLGHLRVYWPLTDAQKLAVEKAVLASKTTCDVCGSSGTFQTDGGWYRVRCPSHVKTRW